jgi:hypothetical protein
MKKLLKSVITVILSLLVGLSLMLHPFPALAEEAAPLPAWDWTGLVVWVIGAVSTFMAALMSRVWMAYVKPWLDEKNLTATAKIVIDAVESILGRHAGPDKWRLALAKMQARGFDIDSDRVLDALRAAWLLLNMQQIDMGIKDPALDPPAGEGGGNP